MGWPGTNRWPFDAIPQRADVTVDELCVARLQNTRAPELGSSRIGLEGWRHRCARLWATRGSVACYLVVGSMPGSCTLIGQRAIVLVPLAGVLLQNGINDMRGINRGIESRNRKNNKCFNALKDRSMDFGSATPA